MAAISIVAYNGISNNANDAAVQSDFSNFAKKYELARTENTSGQYPNPTVGMGLSATKGAYMTGRYNFYLCINPARDRFAIVAQSKSGKYFGYDSSVGKVSTTAATNNAETCTLIGATVGASAFNVPQYSWNSTNSTGSWQPWVN